MAENNKRQTDCGTDDSINKKLKRMDGDKCWIDSEIELEISAEMKELAERLREIHSNPRKFILESRTTADPFSRMERISHVYREGDVMFSVILGLTENEDAIYKIQVLEDNNNHPSVCLYTAHMYNKIGFDLSSKYLDIESAKKEFNELYQELTGNIFRQKPFVQYPEKYYEME